MREGSERPMAQLPSCCQEEGARQCWYPEGLRQMVVAKASLQSGKMMMAPCQEAGDRCAASLSESSADLRCAQMRSTVITRLGCSAR